MSFQGRPVDYSPSRDLSSLEVFLGTGAWVYVLLWGWGSLGGIKVTGSILPHGHMRPQTAVGAVQAGSREASPDHSIFWSSVSHIHSCKTFNDLEVRSMTQASDVRKRFLQVKHIFPLRPYRRGWEPTSKASVPGLVLNMPYVPFVPDPLWGKVLYLSLCRGGSRG